MPEPILQVKNLEVQFLTRKSCVTAIKDVSFNVYKGQTLGIVGESGCGKSVTSTAIMGLLPKHTSRISNGEIILNGEDISKCSEREMQKIRGNKIAMIFQDPMTSLNPVYRVGDQLIEMLRAHRKIGKEEAREVCIDMLKKVGVPAPEQRMKDYPHQLSGGLRQRIMISMALLCEPQVLIADEPTSALDVTIQKQILLLMNQLKEKIDATIMFITHDMGVVAEMSQYVMVMYAGQVVEYDTVEGLFNNPKHPYTIGLLNSIPRPDISMDKLHSIEGTVPGLNEMPTGCRFSNRCTECTEKCRNMEPEIITMGEKQVRCWKYIDGGV